MALKIRLSRHGRSNSPFYWVVLAEATSRRDGKYIAKFGTYNPMIKSGPKIVLTDPEGVRKYLACGAKTTKVVERLLKDTLSVNE